MDYLHCFFNSTGQQICIFHCCRSREAGRACWQTAAKLCASTGAENQPTLHLVELKLPSHVIDSVDVNSH